VSEKIKYYQIITFYMAMDVYKSAQNWPHFFWVA